MHKSEAARKAKKRREAKANFTVSTAVCADDGHDFRGTYFAHKADDVGLGTEVFETYQEFEHHLQHLAEHNKRPKAQDGKISITDNRKISPSHFDFTPNPDKGYTTKRGRQNVVFSNGISLDCDGILAVIDKGEVIAPATPPIATRRLT
jgi:hypothetical protein